MTLIDGKTDIKFHFWRFSPNTKPKLSISKSVLNSTLVGWLVKIKCRSNLTKISPTVSLMTWLSHLGSAPQNKQISLFLPLLPYKCNCRVARVAFVVLQRRRSDSGKTDYYYPNSVSLSLNLINWLYVCHTSQILTADDMATSSCLLHASQKARIGKYRRVKSDDTCLSYH